eukprot:2384960-Pyramimonas_sp.AAC.1
MFWADRVILLAASSFQLTSMLADMTHALRRFGCEWKESSLENMKLGCDHDLEVPLIVPTAGPREGLGSLNSGSHLQLFEQERHIHEHK